MLALAMRLGYASPSRMLRELRPSELGLWRGLWITDPWGEERADLRSAIVAQTVASGLLKRQDDEPFMVEDFMPDYTGKRKRRKKLSDNPLKRFLQKKG